mgnify:CR=1 FL=1
MNIEIKTAGVDLTPALREYVEMKIGSLDKFLRRWELEGEIEAAVQLERTTRHHHKGNVFRAEINMPLPGKLLRAEAYHRDIRMALDDVKNTIKAEIQRYKEREQT